MIYREICRTQKGKFVRTDTPCILMNAVLMASIFLTVSPLVAAPSVDVVPGLYQIGAESVCLSHKKLTAENMAIAMTEASAQCKSIVGERRSGGVEVTISCREVAPGDMKDPTYTVISSSLENNSLLVSLSEKSIIEPWQTPDTMSLSIEPKGSALSIGAEGEGYIFQRIADCDPEPPMLSIVPGQYDRVDTSERIFLALPDSVCLNKGLDPFDLLVTDKKKLDNCTSTVRKKDDELHVSDFICKINGDTKFGYRLSSQNKNEINFHAEKPSSLTEKQWQKYKAGANQTFRQVSETCIVDQ